MDKWLKRIWLVNGVVGFIAAALFIYGWVRTFTSRPPYGYFNSGPYVGENLDKAVQDSLALQDIALTLPRQIGASPYRFIQLRVKDLAVPVRIMKYTDLGPPPSISPAQPQFFYENNSLEGAGAVNIIFLRSDGSDARLLLEKKAFIVSADIPFERDTAQKFNVFRIVFEDTDGDGRLTGLDRSDLYVSEISGKQLRQVTDEKLKVLRYLKSHREGKIILLAKVRPTDVKTPETDWPERIYTFDVKSNQLSPFPADDGLLRKAQELLWKK